MSSFHAWSEPTAAAILTVMVLPMKLVLGIKSALLIPRRMVLSLVLTLQVMLFWPEMLAETAGRIPPLDCVFVGESGIFTRDDALRLQEAGVDAMLVGESLMREKDIAAATRQLLGRD